MYGGTQRLAVLVCKTHRLDYGENRAVADGIIVYSGQQLLGQPTPFGIIQPLDAFDFLIGQYIPVFLLYLFYQSVLVRCQCNP